MRLCTQITWHSWLLGVIYFGGQKVVGQPTPVSFALYFGPVSTFVYFD